ncbi:UDP-N-acetylmuramoyl-L-alanine--D-glutamate ligase [Alkaliphilus peptidifermentans]|uniref:UDP-N-acetylmuramoylalanine--D-glutamate ligase n=1 Tax=Alkaliphilus peptidifermentans DSM 18978 TaxID=1120976 RepID=A0A1G5BF70_9FIRM|nr:UDP-N-acetylmuramoyl-L-alanine--D-glutamate ligase [Alkaliphilus peptidifermentans]SCX88751.1 UDP-N-acetylmuramoylalanine--D-glutamate ligase [Alkaliphilus peptidifermentans DSM 18978]
MNLKDKKILVIGLAVTGLPLVKVLVELGGRVIVNDLKSPKDLAEAIEELRDVKVDYILERHPQDIKELGAIDLAVVSPGIPLDIPFIQKLKTEGIEVIGEIELSYRLSKANIIAITGTNGKTTTTALTGAIFQNTGVKTYVVGNIGVAAISKALETKEGEPMVMEVSSFQLESIVNFHPRVAAILNLTPDHLNRHKTMENYRDAKFNIFANQDPEDYAIINYDDELCRNHSSSLKAKKIYFSRKQQLKEGIYVEDDVIVISFNNQKINVISTDEIKIPGNHNLENALAATAMAFVMGVDIEIISKTLKEFEGVEHRTEYVDTIEGVNFINDSKGTNPDASIKAIEAIKEPIILLAGGMDKGSDFTEFIQSFGGKVKEMIVYGETAEKLQATARALGFNNYTIVKDLDEAVVAAFKLAVTGDTVLLSPACASWDMYPNFEERGKHFKNIVSRLRRS